MTDAIEIKEVIDEENIEVKVLFKFNKQEIIEAIEFLRSNQNKMLQNCWLVELRKILEEKLK